MRRHPRQDSGLSGTPVIPLDGSPYPSGCRLHWMLPRMNPLSNPDTETRRRYRTDPRPTAKKPPQGTLRHCPLMLSPCPHQSRSDHANGIINSANRSFDSSGGQHPRLSRQPPPTSHPGQTNIPTSSWSLATEEHQNQERVRFSITRSDYFVVPAGLNTGAGAAGEQRGEGLRQVEFNTIAASYLGLAGQMARSSIKSGAISATHLGKSCPNQPLTGVVEAFSQVMQTYNVTGACVLFVVQAKRTQYLRSTSARNCLSDTRDPSDSRQPGRDRRTGRRA